MKGLVLIMLFKRKSESRKLIRQRREMAQKLHGKHIKYVVERREDEDYVIGREGAILVKGNELMIFSSQKDVFRSYIDETDLSELLVLRVR